MLITTRSGRTHYHHHIVTPAPATALNCPACVGPVCAPADLAAVRHRVTTEKASRVIYCVDAGQVLTAAIPMDNPYCSCELTQDGRQSEHFDKVFMLARQGSSTAYSCNPLWIIPAAAAVR